MNVEIRAKRILTPLDSYEAVDAGNSSLRAFGSLRGAKPLGIYRNNGASGEEAILISDVGLFLARHDGAIFVDYTAIESVEVAEQGAALTASSKSEADGVLLNGKSANPVLVPVRNGNGRYRDAFEFSRFVSRAAEDSKIVSKEFGQPEADAILARRAS